MKRQIQSYISEEDYSKLKLIAEKEGLLFATLVRQIIINYLKTKNNDWAMAKNTRLWKWLFNIFIWRSKKYKKWQSQIKKDGKTIFLGRYNNELDASIAYQNELNKL